MKTKITLFNLLIIMLLALEAQASNIFVISGKVMTADVPLAQDGLIVTVENTRTGVVGAGETGNFGAGIYYATIFDPFNVELKTQVGDSLKITVKDGDKTLVGLTHVVTESEMEHLVAVVDIYLSGLSANIEPASLVGDGKDKATITVTVTDSAGNAVTDDTITITPTLGKVGNVDDNKDGTYTAVYTAPSITEGKTDVITVASKVLSEETTLSVILQTPPPKCDVTVALQIVPDELTVSTETELSTANITVEVKCEGQSIKDEVVEIVVIGMGTIGDVNNPEDGKYTAVYTAPKTTGTDTITATAKNSGASKSGDITLIPGSITSIEVSANPQTLKSDGISKSTLTAILKDANGNPVDDAEMTFLITLGDGNLDEEVENKGEGQYTVFYTAPEADE